MGHKVYNFNNIELLLNNLSNKKIHEDNYDDTEIDYGVDDYFTRKEEDQKLDERVPSNKVTLKEIKRFILFDKQEYEDINKFKLSGTKIEYVYSDTSSSEIKNNQFIINNNNDKDPITIDFSENEDTLIYCKSGYLNPNIVYLINKFIEKKFTVINDPKAVEISANKLHTAKLLDEYNIRQAKYCVFKRNDTEDLEIDNEENKFDKKLKNIYGTIDEDNEYVCKILDGHGGHGVFICKGKNILSILQCIFAIDKEQTILVQEKFDIKDGDIRVYVLNINGKQEIIDTILRQKDSSDFRTNISLGNGITKTKLNEDQIRFVKRVAKISGLSFAGIDVCVNGDSKDLNVIEINGAPGAPTAININKDENREEHEKFYTNIINTISKMIHE